MKPSEFLDSESCPNIKAMLNHDLLLISIIEQIMEAYHQEKLKEFYNN